ncbi:MAG: hypothetical protein JWN34_6249 [Bryobacterales bacterium]|nr:hypothetical protein [Bryobacterales bacterium]
MRVPNGIARVPRQGEPRANFESESILPARLTSLSWAQCVERERIWNAAPGPSLLRT